MAICCLDNGDHPISDLSVYFQYCSLFQKFVLKSCIILRFEKKGGCSFDLFFHMFLIYIIFKDVLYHLYFLKNILLFIMDVALIFIYLFIVQ